MALQRHLLLIAILTLGGTSAVAEPFVVPDENCTGLYSVQKTSCEVEHVYQCVVNSTPYWRYDLWSPEDGTFTTITTEEGEAVSAYSDYSDSFVIDHVIEIIDPYDTARLLAEDAESFDGIMAIVMPFFLDPIPSRVFGTLKSQSASVTISGVVFKRYLMDFSMTINALDLGGQEDVYVDPETKAVISGEARLDMMGGETLGGDPIAVIKPGETGFLADIALYGCGEMSFLDERILR